MNTPKTDIRVRLVGEDGNIFFILGRVREALRRGADLRRGRHHLGRIRRPRRRVEHQRRRHPVSGKNHDKQAWRFMRLKPVFYLCIGSVKGWFSSFVFPILL